MRYRSALAFLLFAAAAHVAAPHALEVSAGSNRLQNVTNGLDARLNASNAIFQTVINQILACNKKRMIFTPDETDPERDADGCVSPPLPGDISLELEDVTVPTSVVRSETNDFTHTLVLPASIKPWGALSLQINVINGKYSTAPGAAATYTIDDVNADQAKVQIHKATSDGCESPGSASYRLDASYDAATRSILFEYNRSSTKNTTACRTIGFDIYQYQYKKAVLTQ
ncbi:MAG: hypothetical protein H6922_00525 [Pseudomonadaceae bacterium]|nr:hypothetical protein [Pseudomonadaceae bacterium]